MTIYTDLYSTMNWQDGQEVELGFLNNGQRFLRAQVTDQILEKLIASVSSNGVALQQQELTGEFGADVRTIWAYTVHPGSAYLIQGAANNIFNIQAGTLLQKVANADGSDSSLLEFTFTGIEAFPVIANGATNYRIDLLQMQLSYITDTPASVDFEDAATRAKTTNAGAATRRRVQASLTIKQGTPGASPVVPEPDTGFVPVGMVCVGASWTSATAPLFGLEQSASPTQAIVYDLRMPIGVRLLRVDPVLFKLETAWALDAPSSNQVVKSSNATNKMYVGAQQGPGRLIGLMIESLAIFPSNLGLLRIQGGVAPSANFVAANGVVGGTSGPSAGSSEVLRMFRRDFEDIHVPMGGGPTIQPSVTNHYAPPLWMNGYRVPQDPNPAASTPWGSVAAAFVNVGGVNGYVAGVWFIVATGL